MSGLARTGQTISQGGGARYQLLEPLGAGGMGAVYAAQDRLTGQKIALKRVLPTPMQPIPSEMRLALAHEFQALASLRHPHIIAVQDYGFDQAQQPYFTMELLPSARHLSSATIFSLSAKIELLVQLLQALVYIHRRGIIHRDLKPGNVLVSGGQVKLLDFGLAAAAGQESAPSGTLMYMAPEMLHGHPATVASDLYAVGVLAYELLAGWHPFVHASSIVNAILLETPDFTYLEIEPALTAVLQTLLSKEPEQRYPDAGAVMVALCHACHRALPPETEVTRDSFLQTAPFIGREQELGRLVTALQKTAAGSGSGWLVRGESGIGKSRLLQELRTQALVQGVFVLRGVGHPDGGAYQVWSDLLRPLLFHTPPDDLEAAVLRPILPDIERLLDRPISLAPPLEAKTALTRLHLTVTGLVRRAAQSQPLLLLLEDLHWADTASLELLQSLVEAPRLLLVGSYRTGERPDLPQQLSACTLLPLNRLAASHVADLCAAVLGENGRQPHLIDFVQRQSEGNTFFIIEVMRALAEEAGRLDEIIAMSLPLTVFAGSIQQVVQRRLERIPPVFQSLLGSAAVAGRRLDLTLLAHLYPNTDMDEWLTLCANAAVIERPDGEWQWQFSHDKLREGLLSQLEPAAQAQLHKQIAQGIEAVYAANLTPYYAELAFHFGQAAQVGKQKTYLSLTARQAAADYANEYALACYQQLLPLLTDETVRAEALGQMGLIYKRIGQWDEAGTSLRLGLAAAQHSEDTFLQAHILQTLGNLERGRGHYPAALEWLEQARAFHQQQAEPVGLCATLVEVANVYYQQGQYQTARHHLAHALTAAETADDPTSLAIVQHNLGGVAYSQGDYQTAKTHFNQALAIRQTLADKTALADSYNNLGLVAFRQEDFAAAQTYLQQSLTLRRAIGDRYGEAASLNNLGMVPYQQGDMETARHYWQEVLSIRQTLGDTLGTAAVVDNLALIAMSQEDFSTAAQLFTKAIALRRQLGDQQGLAVSLANQARLETQMGEWAAAVGHYRESLSLAAAIGDQLGIVFAMAGVAAVWVSQGFNEDGTSLLAAAATHLERVNGHWESDEEVLYQEALSQARQTLPPERFETAWQTGCQLSVTAAQQRALTV